MSVMDINEAYKILGIYDRSISSDELREVYKIRLSQCSGINKKRNMRNIKLANQIVRNYRCSESWKGSKPVSSNRTSVTHIPAKTKRNSSLFWKILSIVLFIIILIICF